MHFLVEITGDPHNAAGLLAVAAFSRRISAGRSVLQPVVKDDTVAADDSDRRRGARRGRGSGPTEAQTGARRTQTACLSG